MKAMKISDESPIGKACIGKNSARKYRLKLPQE